MDDKERKKLGDRIQTLREQAGLSQPELARLAEIPVSTLRGLEIGRREPKFSTAAKLAKAIGVSLEAFLDKPRRVPA